MSNGKGSARRPKRVSDAELAASWARTFLGVELEPWQVEHLAALPRPSNYGKGPTRY